MTHGPGGPQHSSFVHTIPAQLIFSFPYLGVSGSMHVTFTQLPAAPQPIHVMPPVKRFRVVDTRKEVLLVEVKKEAVVEEEQSDAGHGLVEVKEEAVVKEEQSESGHGLVEIAEQKDAKKVCPRILHHPI